MGLKQLLSNLELGLNAYPNHNTLSSAGGFNYDQSTTRIFDNKDKEQFRQKSFKFGEGTAFDRPLMGFSKEPFVTNPTVDLFANNPDYQILGDTLTDGLIRGGAITHAERLITDAERIGRFLLTPKGIAFNIKQVGLQLTNPKINQPRGTLLPGNTKKANQRTYNLGINTLASVVSAGTGLRIKREGWLPTSKEGYDDAIGDPAQFDNGKNLLKDYEKNKNNNRLLTLFDEHITIPNQNTTLYSYAGGPGSTYGIGTTTIIKSKSTSFEATQNYKGLDLSLLNPQRDKLTAKGYIPNSKFSISDSSIIFKLKDKPFYSIGGGTLDGKVIDEPTSKLGDPRPHTQFLPAPSTKNKAKNYLRILNKPGTDYFAEVTGKTATYHREERINMGNPGAKSSRDGTRDPHITTKTKDGFLDYSIFDSSRIDKLNALDVFHSNNGLYTDHAVRDLIRFRFEMVDNDNPGEYDAIVFRAFMDDIGDSYSANYNTFKYNGRGEEFYTYNSFKRSINFSFKIAASSRHEMRPLYRKLNYLVSNTAPDYGPTGRMRTPFTRLTIGSWCDRIPGVINSVNLKWQKDYPWEIAISGPEGNIDKNMVVLPHVMDVSVQFTPVHNFLPEKSIHSPFIIPHDINNTIFNEEQKWYKDDIATTLEGARIDRGQSETIDTTTNSTEVATSNNISTPSSEPQLPQDTSTGGLLTQDALIGRFGPQNQR
jgi:hypothetical protein